MRILLLTSMSDWRIESRKVGRRSAPDRIELEVDSPDTLLDEMGAARARIARQMPGEDGMIRLTLNIFVNRQNGRSLQELDTLHKDGDDVLIVPTIAGQDGNHWWRGSALRV